MRNSKEFFLSTLGVSIEPELSQFHIVFKRPNEFKPFGELVTTKDGKTVLRVGAAYEDGITVVVP